MSIAATIQIVRKRSKKLKREIRLLICFRPSTLESLLSDIVDFLLDRKAVKTGKRETQEQADPAFERKERFAETSFHFRLGSVDRGGIGHAPVRRNGLPGPYGTHFVRRVVTHSEHEIESGSARLGKFIPALAAQALGGKMSDLKFAESFGADLACRMAPSAIS
jgi:hypothetical protein